MALKIRRKKSINVLKVGIKVISTVIGLYASGLMLTTMGNIMINTSSPFYAGLKLIGWTVGNSLPTTGGSDYVGYNLCNGVASMTTNSTTPVPNCVTNTSGSGILAVVGLLAMVWIIFEFVDVSF